MFPGACTRLLLFRLLYFILVQFTESPSILEPDEDLSFGEPNLLGEVDAFLARQERLSDEPRLHRVHLPAREHRAPARPVAMATRTCRDRDEPIGCCRCPAVVVRRTTAHVRRGSSPRAAEVLRRHNRTNKAVVDITVRPLFGAAPWCVSLSIRRGPPEHRNFQMPARKPSQYTVLRSGLVSM